MTSHNPYLDKTYKEYLVDDNQKSKKLIKWFLDYDIENYFKLVNKDIDWNKLSQERALDVFHLASKKVPAYKNFLTTNKINPSKIKNWDDFKNLVPETDKYNYIDKYSLQDLTLEGKLYKKSIISFSSGSTGNPYFWPRSIFQEVEGALLHEAMLNSLFDIKNKKTLIVICFSLGNYVAGTYTFQSLNLLTKKGYDLTIVTPGIDMEGTFKMLKNNSQYYDQTILCGYPPFIKDIIDSGTEKGVSWKKINVKFLLASEFFSEKWRKYLLKKAGQEDLYFSSTNIYGAADATMFGYETPLTTYFRIKASSNPQFHKKLFGDDLTPTLVQYNPLFRYFDVSEDKELLLTCASTIPLVKYNLHDKGGILNLYNIEDNLTSKHDSSSKMLYSSTRLPAVYILSRTDGAASFYGILIYPEYINSAIEMTKYQNKLSGKFTIIVKKTSKMNPYLEINIEKSANFIESLEFIQELTKDVYKSLKKKCLEYNTLEGKIGQKAYPRIVLHEKGSSKHFQIGIKQKWIEK